MSIDYNEKSRGTKRGRKEDQRGGNRQFRHPVRIVNCERRGLDVPARNGDRHVQR